MVFIVLICFHPLILYISITLIFFIMGRKKVGVKFPFVRNYRSNEDVELILELLMSVYHYPSKGECVRIALLRLLEFENENQMKAEVLKFFENR